MSDIPLNNDQDAPNVDFLSPEEALESGVNFDAKIQREKFLSGSSNDKKEEQGVKKWENGVRKSIEINGKNWQYLEYGNPDGAPILNIHGWLGSSAEGQDHLSRVFAGEPQNSPGMQKLSQENPNSATAINEKIKALEGKYHIISPELPGFGATEPLDKVSLDIIADSLAAFQKGTKTENAIVVGSSMGGILGIKLAARHPEMVKSLALQGTMTQPKDMSKVPYVAAQIATWGPIPAILERFNMTKKLFSSIVKGSKDFQMADSETQKRILEATEKSDLSTSTVTLREIGKDITSDIEKINCPVIVIDGANGELVPIMKSHDMSKRFYPNISTEEKFPEKVVFLPLGGNAGKHGHNIVNTFPEGVASWTDYVLDKME